jgi:hypothetical protein
MRWLAPAGAAVLAVVLVRALVGRQPPTDATDDASASAEATAAVREAPPPALTAPPPARSHEAPTSAPPAEPAKPAVEVPPAPLPPPAPPAAAAVPVAVGPASAPVQVADATAAPDATRPKTDEERSPALKEPSEFATMSGVLPGSAFRSRFSRASAQKEGATPSTEAAVDAALLWLSAHQSANGGWEARGFGGWCKGARVEDVSTGDEGSERHDVGATGLAVLAFLGTGRTELGEGPHAAAIRRGLDWLVAAQKPDGSIGFDAGQGIYDHAIATLALVEAVGLTGKRAAPAQKAIDFLLSVRNPTGVWRYGVRPRDGDTSVTGWAMMPLEAARRVGDADREAGRGAFLDVSDAPWPAIALWVDTMTLPNTGLVGYTSRSAHSPTNTAVGVLARVFLGEDPTRAVLLRKGMDSVLAAASSSDAYAYSGWYFGSLAAHEVGGATWDAWSRLLVDRLLPTQRTGDDPCGVAGSFDPGTDVWMSAGGRVASTAIAALSLEAYYRYGRKPSR